MRTQLDFASPYLIMIINVVLGIYAVLSISGNTIYQYIDPNILAEVIIQNINFILFTVITSLIMHKKTTSKQ